MGQTYEVKGSEESMITGNGYIVQCYHLGHAFEKCLRAAAAAQIGPREYIK